LLFATTQFAGRNEPGNLVGVPCSARSFHVLAPAAVGK